MHNRVCSPSLCAWQEGAKVTFCLYLGPTFRLSLRSFDSGEAAFVTITEVFFDCVAS